MTTVVFDVGNVLLKWDPYVPLRSHFGDDETTEQYFKEVDFNTWNRSLDAGRDWDEAVETLSKDFPHHSDATTLFRDDWHSTITGVIDESVEALRTLHGRGDDVYAITNFSHKRWYECLERFDFLKDCFKDAVVSGEHKMLKPDAAIFELLLQRNNLKAKDCIFIDDSFDNVTAAAGLGFETIHFTPETVLKLELGQRGVDL